MLDYRIDVRTKVMLTILLMAVIFILTEPITAEVNARILLLALIFILAEPTTAEVAARNCTHVMQCR